MSKNGFTTKLLHTPYAKNDPHGSLRMPIYDAAAFEFEDAEGIADAFSGERPAHVYTRGSNPTTTHFENMVQQVTNAQGVVAMASGMATISNAFMALLQPGENVLVSSRLFGNTFGLFQKTFPSLGFDFRFVDFENLVEVEKQIDGKTRAVFVETITNPLCEVVDLSAVSELAKKYKLVVLADSTMTPLLNFDAKKFGVDVELISTTKFISGGATSVGGILIDHGTYDWGQLEKLEEEAAKFKKMAFIARLRKEYFRNFGSCLSPNNAYLQSLGLETLELRFEKACSNSLKVAQWLDEHPKVKRVYYPGLENSGYKAMADKQFESQFGALLSFELESKQACMEMLNKLEIIRRATNLNDNKSLIIHPASTIYVEFTQEQKDFQGVSDELIRLSVGIENVYDLIDDLEQALA